MCLTLIYIKISLLEELNIDGALKDFSFISFQFA